MKSAIPMARGSERSSASTAAQIVPKMRGQTYDQKLSVRSDAVSPVARNAGTLCTMRKIATAARVTRIMLPANTADREKMRSPRLRTGLAEVAPGARLASLDGGLAGGACLA